MKYDEAKRQLGSPKTGRDRGNGLVLKVEQIENYFISPGRTASIRKFKEFVFEFNALDDNKLEEVRLNFKNLDKGYHSFPFIQLIERIQSIRKREPHKVLMQDIDKFLSHQSEPVSISSIMMQLDYAYHWKKLGTFGAFQCTLKELGYQEIHLTTKGGKTSSATYIEPPVVLYNRMLDRCENWQGAHLDDGDSVKCAFNSAHEKVRKEFGDKKYEEFCLWLDFDSPGPHG